MSGLSQLISKLNSPRRTADHPILWSEERLTRYILLGLIVSIICAYSAVVRCDFIELDDRGHVFENPLVVSGLTWEGVKQAFLAPHACLWIPLTWISLMLDVSLFGMNPGAMHAINLVLHATAAVLLFISLRRLTGRLWESAAVAALFGLHPINVESVAWVTERKNVLCAVFWALTLFAYARFTERPQIGRYLTALGIFSLALLAKPAAVTLPPTLLLLDVWPLRRHERVGWWRLLVEKIPFLCLVVFASWMQMSAVTPVSATVLPIAARVSNALLSYVIYLRDFIYPAKLGLFYPHTKAIDFWGAGCSAVFLITVTGIAFKLRKTHPYLIVGWCWFLGNLVPNLGLIQVGGQARADRFTYMAQIGVFMALVWLVRSLAGYKLLAGAVGGSLLAFACLTSRQVSFWMDSITICEHTLRVTEQNAPMLALAGLSYTQVGDYHKAVTHYHEALRLRPWDADSANNLGDALTQLGRDEEAVTAFTYGLQVNPQAHAIRRNLANTLLRLGKIGEAIPLLRGLAEATPGDLEVQEQLRKLDPARRPTDNSSEDSPAGEHLAPNSHPRAPELVPRSVEGGHEAHLDSHYSPRE
jgi:tetratricopeptide (TPR) repeat protein